MNMRLKLILHETIKITGIYLNNLNVGALEWTGNRHSVTSMFQVLC